MPGDGAIYRRVRTSPNGRTYERWVAAVSTGGRTDRHIVRRVCRTQREAREVLGEMLAQPSTVSRLSLGDYLRSWLDATARPRIAPSTYDGYEDVIASLAPIAAIPLGDLTPEDIEYVLNRMTAQRTYQKVARHAAPKTVHNALAMLRTALGAAERRGHIPRNVARLVDMPRVPRRHGPAMTADDARAILAAVEGDRYEAAVALGLCGLRLGEVLGLAWHDVDLDAGSAAIRYQLRGSGKAGRLAPLKTVASERSLSLPAFAVSRLRAHEAAQLLERIASGTATEPGLVFVTPRGWPVSGSWLTKHYQALLAAAGLPRQRFHDLRHGTATLLAAAGVHPRVAQEYLRHASSRVTMDVYTHVVAAQERDAADVLDRMVGG